VKVGHIRRFSVCAILFGVALILSRSSGMADFMAFNGSEVAPNIAEIRITEDGVRIKLEVYVGDIKNFDALVPDSWLKDDASQRATSDERMADFAENGLSIRRVDGTALPVVAQLVERRRRVDRASPLAGKREPMTGRVFPKPPDDPRVLYAELFYPFYGDRPDILYFAPPLNAEGNARVSIGMVAFDRDVPVTDFRYLARKAALNIDWQDPWYSRFNNPNLLRHHRWPMMSFLYAEPYEIRHEALLRVRDAAALAGVEISGRTVSEAERKALEMRLPAILNDRSPMSIDGIAVTPDFDRLSYLRIGSKGLVFLQPGEEIRTDGAIVGLIYSSPTNGMPKEATVEWTVFTDSIGKVPGNAIDIAGPFLMDLTPEYPVLKWTNHFKESPYPPISAVLLPLRQEVPVLIYLLGAIIVFGLGTSIVWVVRRDANTRRVAIFGVFVGMTAAAGLPLALDREVAKRTDLDMAELTTMTDALLNNVYRSFDFKTEDQVYDRLALTLQGDILERVYLEQRLSLRIERAGGASARVDRLDVQEVQVLPGDETGVLRLRANWAVSGTVGHWGHTHRRTNSYVADLTVVPVDKTWRIRDFDVLSQERLN
jgi:hypothetical protein